MVTLTLQLPNLPPVEHVLKDEAVTIGRMKGNTIALDDVSVSLSHAKLTFRDGEYYLKDLNSTNGTLVNGQSITEVRLRDGDQVKFGEVVGHFRLSPGPVSNSTAPVASAPVPASPALLSQTAVKLPTARKSPWLPLAVKVGGLAVIGLLLWKFVFSQPNLPPETAVLPEKTSVPAATQTTAAAAMPQNSAAETQGNERVAALIQSLKSSDVQERRRAVTALNAMRSGALPAVPALREALNDSDSEVRIWAAMSLISNRVYDRATVPILIQVLHHENPTLRQVACLSLALIPYEEAEKEPVIAALTECMSNDANAEVRNAALSALKTVAHNPVPAGK